MYISGRERKILLQLFNTQEVVTVKDLAETLQVSERTIHRDLKKIEHTLSEYDVKLVKKTGQGLQINGSEKDMEQLHSMIISEAVTDFTPEERKTIILTMLLERKDPIKLFALAHELDVTSATVSNDLDQLEAELATFDLFIARKKGLGIQIQGEEARKRSLLSHLITENMNPLGLASQLKVHIQKQRKSNRISDRLMGYVDPEILEVIEKEVECASQELPNELADSGFIGLVVHLALAIKRIQKGDVIQFDKGYLREIEGTVEYEIAKNLIKKLEVTLSLNIPEDEIGYITMHLLGAKLRTNRNHLMEDASLDIAVKANELIRNVSEQLNKNLSDNKLLQDLIIHLKPAVYRLKQGMPIKNPMLKEIKRDYLEFFQMVENAARKTFPEIEFPEDEIGYLVLHFAATLLQEEGKSNLKALVICSSGIGTSNMLATKLLQKLPEITMVENKSMFELSKDVSDMYDLVISTIPLEGLADKYILISPMLTETELGRIQREIRKKALVARKDKRTEHRVSDTYNKLESIQNYSNVMMDILHQFTVQQAFGTSMKSVLKSICMELDKSKIINSSDTVLEKLQKREKQGGLGIPNSNLSLHHTRSDHVLLPCFKIFPLIEALPVKGMDGELVEVKRILLMLAPENTESEVLDVFSFISGLVIESIELFESGSEQQIKQFLSDQFYEFLKEQNLM